MTLRNVISEDLENLIYLVIYQKTVSVKSFGLSENLMNVNKLEIIKN